MWAAIILSVAVLASAEDPVSLRGSRSLSNVVENVTWQQRKQDSELAAGNVSENASEPSTLPSNVSGNVSGLLPLLQSGLGWYQIGDKIWGSGSGVENINFFTAGYFDQGMYAARERCGGPGCALIVNPAGHRTIHTFHIHFVHYEGYGANLKERLESRVCGESGWRGGGFPCHGKAAFFPGFPGVFSAALSGGELSYASVIAWPASCGGQGTIVQLAYGCSIEHQIRGDYDPRKR